MNLTKNKLFIGILVFLLLINILVIFNLNYLYLQAILSFIFLVTIPGLFIMLMFKIRKIGFWEYLVYTIGLSIAFLMFGGLFANWTLPLVGIDKPLSLIPLLISFNVFLIIFWLIAYKRNKKILLKIRLPKLNLLNKVFLTIPMIFPVLSILGAIILNNHGPNYLTMIMLGGIAIYVFLVVLFRKKLNENIYPLAILMISVSLLLMFSLRSWHISGWDIHREYLMFQLTKENFHWSMLNFRDAYNACLSITILPTFFLWFLKINDEYIFKLCFQLIFSFVPVVVYLFLRRYTKNVFAFIASFFFMSLIWFIQELPTLTRQEISLLFFTLTLLILFNKNINSTFKKILFLIFGFSMIVSHYSTSYIALAFFLSTYMLTFFYKKWENRKIRKGRLKSSERQEFYLTGILVLLLFIFGFSWYSQLTEIATGSIDFAKKSFSNIGKIFNEELSISAKHALLIDVKLNTPEQIKNYTQSIIEYYKEKKPQMNFYEERNYISYNTIPLNSETMQPIINSLTIKLTLFYLFKIIKFLINEIFILIGLLYFLLFKLFKKSKIDNEFIIMALVGALLVGIILFIPYTSIEYNLERIYQQTLVILSLPTILGGLILFKFLKENIRMMVIPIIFTLFFLFYSGFIFQFIGGPTIISLNNFGNDYDKFYTHTNEVKSAQWILNNYDKKYLIYADELANLRLLSFAKINNAFCDILPSIIDKNAYVYTSYTNVIEGITFRLFEGITLSYNFPTKFLNENKNKIYTNGGSEIFK